MLVQQHAPNPVGLSVSQNSTAWNIVASDGVLYASLAALTAAGKKPFPGLEGGGFLQWLAIRSTDSTGAADGAGFAFFYNVGTAPTDNNRLVTGAGATAYIPGPVNTLWIKKNTGTDIIQLQGAY